MTIPITNNVSGPKSDCNEKIKGKVRERRDNISTEHCGALFQKMRNEVEPALTIFVQTETERIYTPLIEMYFEESIHFPATTITCTGSGG